MPDKEYQSEDKRFGMRLPVKELSRMLGYCNKAKQNETGGILVGSYTERQDWAIVKTASKEPRDSQAGPTWFRRGVRGLQRWLGKLWKSKTFYLGEWHFHPYAAPDPSNIDIAEMVKVAAAESYYCPEPLLMIVGGDPASDWQLRAFVFRRGQPHVQLFPLSNDIDTEGNAQAK